MDLVEMDDREMILERKPFREGSQRCCQITCTRRWAAAILVGIGIFVLLIAVIAAFARPGSQSCQTDEQESQGGTPTPTKDYISTDGRPFPWKDIRLPRSVLPDIYEIFLHPNISQSVFSGSVRIHSSVVTATDFFVFHVKDLNVTKVTVLREEVEVKLADTMEYKANEQFYVRVKQKFAADSKIIIVVDFRAALASKMAGFYKSSYKTAAGEKRLIATTQFEPTDARAAFPCFDEPDLKANFSLSIVREPQYITLFNMPLKNTSVYQGELLKDEHETSKKMSTYLVAFVVCDFKNISSHTKQNTLVRVFAPEDQIDQAHYALDVAVKTLDYYTDFFGVPYPLPKQDMIAIPDFSAGAMENWGLITYRMTSILYDPEKTSPYNKQWITITITHELAHQWFGNLVTMKWWDDLWLNEGFASFVEYNGSNHYEPSFGMADQFVYETTQVALHEDSFATSHPIQVEVSDPAQINEIFDRISYDKGASLIAMLQDFLGEDAFKKGLHKYLMSHAYGNARTADLWQALQETSDMPQTMTVKDVMNTWTLQMGYPVITVRRKPGTQQLVLSQDHFLLGNGSDTHSKPKSPYNYLWKVPLTYRTKANPDKKLLWLKDKEMTSDLTLADTDWIKFNLETQGFYRVNYEPDLWRRIIKQLKEDVNVFSVRDRAGLLGDVFALARAGLLSYDIVFELLGYFDKETEYVPMKTAIDGYTFIGKRLYLTDVYPKFQQYMRDLISTRLTSMGWTSQTQHQDKLLQKALLAFAIHLDDKDTIEKAKQMFQSWSGIPDNLRLLVYAMGVKYGDDVTWQHMYNNFTASNVPTEKKQFLEALTCTTDPRRIQLFLRDSLNKTLVRSQDTSTVMGGLAGHEAGHMFVWRFLRQNWEMMYKRYGRTSFTLDYTVKTVVTPFSTQFDYDEVTAFFKDKDLGSGSRALKQSLEMVKSHIDWTAHNQDSIMQWFQNNVKDIP